jgi:hypothetical protein
VHSASAIMAVEFMIETEPVACELPDDVLDNFVLLAC